MTSTVAMPELRSATLDELAVMLGDAGDSMRAAILAECDRRDGIGALARADRAAATRAAERAEWERAAYEQYRQALHYTNTNGTMFGKATIARARLRGDRLREFPDLWTCNEATLRSRASEELLDFFDASPRLTLGTYRRQLAASKRAPAEERERAATELPEPATLIALVKADGLAALNQYEAAGIDELVSAKDAAAWLGLSVQTIYVDMSPSRNRWPQPDYRAGRASLWTRRTLIAHLASRAGQGARGTRKPRRKSEAA